MENFNNLTRKGKNQIIDTLLTINEYEGTEVSEIHNELFNTDYFIIGYYQAEQWLKEYGIFAAIETIKNYEQDNFGEVTTDFSSPENVANMLAYIIGEEVLSNCATLNENYDSELTDEIIKEAIEYFESL
jgi:hypothetical protein